MGIRAPGGIVILAGNGPGLGKGVSEFNSRRSNRRLFRIN
jgi:hypothetical protein